MSRRRIVTDEEAAAEIEALRDSEFVKLARREQRLKYSRRQALYTLRNRISAAENWPHRV